MLSFIGFCSILYASAGARLAVVSKMHVAPISLLIVTILTVDVIPVFFRFSLVWLTVMTLFPLSLLLLKFNRGRLPRAPNTPLRVIFSAFAVAAAVFAGNIALDPDTAVCVFFDPPCVLVFLTQDQQIFCSIFRHYSSPLPCDAT